MKVMLGVIGGTGVSELSSLKEAREERAASPFGEPSGPLCLGTIGGTACAFLSRHGAGHRIPPSDINYRANIDALKRVGVSDILSISACGSFREEIAPGDIVLVDQFIDRTRGRVSSFFGEGLVAHVPMADPTSKRLRAMAEAVCRAEKIRHKAGGTYLAMEGPHFSTRAESRLYRSWGADVVGMTNMPEAKLAREAEIPYATLACVTDYDSWRAADSDVDVAEIMSVLQQNAAKAARIVAGVAKALGERRDADRQGLDNILDSCLITREEHRAPEIMARLDAILARYLKAQAAGGSTDINGA